MPLGVHGLRYLFRALLLTLVAAAIGLVMASSASAQPNRDDDSPSVTDTASAYPPPGLCTVTLGSATLSPGQSVGVSGSGFSPNVAVTLSLDSTGLGSFQTNGSGDLSASVTMPADLVAGAHTIKASANNLSCQIGASYTAPTTAPTPTPTPSSGTNAAATDTGGLAFTGFAAKTVSIIGGLLLIGGVGLLWIGRRRKA